MFFRKNKKSEAYDRDKQIPMIKASICNGEQVAGFKDISTGRFEEIALIRTQHDLEVFKAEYGIEGDIPKVY